MRLIDADELLLDIDKYRWFEDAKLIINRCPTIVVKKGYWKPLTHDDVYGSGNYSIELYLCSYCGESVGWEDMLSHNYKFCPWCGANMRGDNEIN